LVEAEFLLELLMGLLTDPPRLDRSGDFLSMVSAGRFEGAYSADGA